MKREFKKFIGMVIVGAMVSTSGVLSYAEVSADAGTVQETVDQTAEVTDQEGAPSEETVSEPFSAAVTMKFMEHEYNIVLDELGGVILVEGPDAELAASLVEQGKSLDESIKLIAASYSEETEYTLSVSSTDQELATKIEESLKAAELTEEIIETEISEQPDFIKKRFETAKLLGITPGKVRLIEKLAASGTQEIKYEDWATKSVKEIMSATKTVKTESLKAGKSVIQKDSKVQAKSEKVKPEKAKTEKPKAEKAKPSSAKAQSKAKGK